MTFQLVRPLVSLDTETTGLHPRIDRIVQIGLIKIYPDGKRTEWNTLVNPNIRIPPEATEIHGISDEDVKFAPVFASLQVAGILSAGLRDCDITGYNVSFDLQFLKKEFELAKMLSPEWGEVVDPSRIFQLMEKRTLTAAMKFYLNKDLPEAHNALIDARASLQVLEAQLERYPDLPKDIPSLSLLLDKARSNHLDPQGKLAWRHGEVTINFRSQYLGVPLKSVDKGFLKWILTNDFSVLVKKIVREAMEGRFPRKKNDGDLVE